MIIFSFLLRYVQWKYLFSNNTTVCVPYVKPVKYITFLCHLTANTNRDEFFVLYFWLANAN